LIPLAGVPGAVLYAVVGLVGGSFATAASYRLPRELPIAVDRSRCPACDHVLGPADLVPVLSWIAAHGRCRHCGARVPIRYPLTELTAAALFLLAWWQSAGDPLTGALLALTTLGLLIIVVADLEARIIPDKVQIAMIPLALVWRWQATDGDWLDGAAGVLLGGGLMYGLREAFLRLRGVSALGLGDVKFVALAGLYVGLTGLAPFLVLAGCLGIVFGLVWRGLGYGAAFPFGPALCCALAVAVYVPWLADFPWIG
jgi:prepilin signal peptidase PulO-like enzyme (type II secretory pathway)